MKSKKMLVSIALSLEMTMFLSNCVYAENIKDTKILDVKRISGQDRYITSIEVSKSGWKEESDNLIIASGEEFPDALCAVPLSKKFDAPILLVSKNSIKEETLDEIKRLNPKKIFIMGLEGSISKDVENEIKSVQTHIKMERIGGKDRYETSTKIAEKLNPSKVVIASGENFADALSIAPIAAQKEIPILLTAKENMSLSVKKYIKDKKIKSSILVGGQGVISREIEDGLCSCERLYGSERYLTNEKIIDRFKNDISFERVYIAVGGPDKTDFADALSGAALAAKTKSSVILVDKNKNELKGEFITKDLLKNIKEFKVIVLGGNLVIKDNLIDDIKLAFQNVIDNCEEKSPNTEKNPVTPTTNITKEDKLLKDINESNPIALEQIFKENTQLLGINLSTYNTLIKPRQDKVWSDLIDNKPEDGYKSLSNIGRIFNDLVDTRAATQQELNKVNAAVDAKCIDTLKDLGFLTNVSKKINSASYTVFSSYKIDAMKLVFNVDEEYNRLLNNTNVKLTKLISKKYGGYGEMLESLQKINNK